MKESTCQLCGRKRECLPAVVDTSGLHDYRVKRDVRKRGDGDEGYFEINRMSPRGLNAQEINAGYCALTGRKGSNRLSVCEECAK